jgi:hypothetical protein
LQSPCRILNVRIWFWIWPRHIKFIIANIEPHFLNIGCNLFLAITSLFPTTKIGIHSGEERSSHLAEMAGLYCSYFIIALKSVARGLNRNRIDIFDSQCNNRSRCSLFVLWNSKSARGKPKERSTFSEHKGIEPRQNLIRIINRTIRKYIELLAVTMEIKKTYYFI